jgi:cell division protein FtsB
MINLSGLRTLVISSVLAGALCFGYWKYREVDARKAELRNNQQAIENLRKEVRDLETRLEQTRAHVKAMESDPVEAEAIARRIGRAVRSKTETVFHLDESRMTPGAPPEPVPAVPATDASQAAPPPEAAPPVQAPAPAAP